MEVDGEARPFLLFSKPKSSRRTEPQPQVQSQPKPPKPDLSPAVQTDHGGSGDSDDSDDSGSDSDADPAPTVETDHGDTCSADGAAADALASFADLGLSEWLVDVCTSLGMRRPTAVQRRCIPRALAGENVLGIAETGSGKTAAFALPILHRLGEDPFGVAALALAPTRELAAQLAEQFRALGSPLGLRCLAAIGGFDSLAQAKGLARRPHVVVATPGRIATLIKNDPDLAKVFARTKFLVLDEADRVVDANFEEDLKVIFDCLPKKRQTFLFSATMSDNLRSLLELSGSKSYFFEAYEGFKTVENLKQQYIHIPPDGKELHLLYLLSKMKEDNIRSAIVFVSTCRTCQYLDFVLQELGRPAVSLHSHKAQSQRLSALHRFKSGQVPVLIATDVASRGLDIQTVDLVINYDIPRFPRDYIHRVGRTARATRGGLSISFVTQRDICLLHEIEDDVGNRFDAYECDDKEVTKDITKVFKARRLANMRMADEGHEDKVQDRKDQKKRDQARKRKHDE
ncbi:DEAD-box ATP-dependent RNA helicase 36 [Triticum urartu]|uniref:DEAD-box ATP-dependent RNA helicase 36 n=1 Tax=Triticum urartu TaxID=4572 RepID=A0A8R7PBE7_TRIUA|nr:DEAD-box ATP-dependent RNA helicase 36 [Triticum urartu]